jgi:CheY-like chemotaxis protein
MRFLMVTTETENESIEAALREGADDYLVKLFDEEGLFDKLRLAVVDAPYRAPPNASLAGAGWSPFARIDRTNQHGLPLADRADSESRLVPAAAAVEITAPHFVHEHRLTGSDILTDRDAGEKDPIEPRQTQRDNSRPPRGRR